MADVYCPSVSTDFIIDFVKKSGKVAKDGIFRIGSTVNIVKDGNQAIHKRMTIIRELEYNCTCYDQAIGISINHNFLSDLLEWLKKEKNWKDGSYIVPQT